MRNGRQNQGNKYNLPSYFFTTKGGINTINIAKVQRKQVKEGTDTYNRYKDFWREMESGGIISEDDLEIEEGRRSFFDVVNESTEISNNYIEDNGKQFHSVEDARDSIVQRVRNISKGEKEIWVGIKFDEDENHYRLRDINGESLEQEEFERLQKDSDKYTEFEFDCWSGFTGEEIRTEDYLHEIVAELLELPIQRIKGAKVDSEYDEEIGDVILTFKARIESR